MNKKLFLIILFILPSRLFGATIVFHAFPPFGFSIPSSKDFKDIITVDGNDMKFHESVFFFIYYECVLSGFINSINSLYSHLTSYKLLIYTVYPQDYSGNITAANTFPLLDFNYPNILTHIQVGQTIDVSNLDSYHFQLPLTNFSDTILPGNQLQFEAPSVTSCLLTPISAYSTKDCFPDNTLETNTSKRGKKKIKRLRAKCLYGCSLTFRDSRYAHHHHKSKHKATVKKIEDWIKQGLNCPECKLKITSLLDLSFHLRKHKYSNYFDFLTDL